MLIATEFPVTYRDCFALRQIDAADLAIHHFPPIAQIGLRGRTGAHDAPNDPDGQPKAGRNYRQA